MLIIRLVVAPFLLIWGLVLALFLTLGAVLTFIGTGQSMTVRITFPRMK